MGNMMKLLAGSAPRIVLGLITATGVFASVLLDLAAYGDSGTIVRLEAGIQRGLLAAYEITVSRGSIGYAFSALLIVAGFIAPFVAADAIKTPLSGFTKGVGAIGIILMFIPKAPYDANKNLFPGSDVTRPPTGRAGFAVPPADLLDTSMRFVGGPHHWRWSIPQSLFSGRVALAAEDTPAPPVLLPISVRLLIPQGEKLISARITVLNRDAREIVSFGTIELPEFRFLAPPGRFRIVIEAENFPLLERDFEVEKNATEFQLEVRLK